MTVYKMQTMPNLLFNFLLMVLSTSILCCRIAIDSKDRKNLIVWSKCKTNSRFPHLRPRSFFKVPPYFGLVPIKSMISGIQLAKIAYARQINICNNSRVIKQHIWGYFLHINLTCQECKMSKNAKSNRPSSPLTLW